jgi:hypothetical protein
MKMGKMRESLRALRTVTLRMTAPMVTVFLLLSPRPLYQMVLPTAPSARPRRSRVSSSITTSEGFHVS